jgi:zinc/manganese transport system ATP-binding protein
MHAAIELDQLVLARPGRTVLSGLSAAIRPGEFIGIFGPNGAGKSTLLHALLGLLRPAGGGIRVLGRAPLRGNPGVGYLPQKRGAVADLRVRGRDFVASALHGERWGLPQLGKAGAAEVDWAIGVVEASPLADRALSTLSGGELQRLLLAQAVLGKPRLLLLDEPMISLDPRYARSVVALVKRLQEELAMTVLFTAHDVNPLLGAMDRVLYLGRGRGAIGPVDEVISSGVLSDLYGIPVEVLRVNGRIAVLSGQGLVEADAHLHEHSHDA